VLEKIGRNLLNNLIVRFREAFMKFYKKDVAVMLQELGNCLNEVADQNVLRSEEVDALFGTLERKIFEIDAIVSLYWEVGWVFVILVIYR